MSDLKIAYLINLDRRPDRWLEFNSKASDLAMPVERFSAVDARSLTVPGLHTPPVIAACWMSHQDVAKRFLESNAQYCLVLEDDVALTNKTIQELNLLWKRDFREIDLLQIGFCISNDRLSNRAVYNRQVRVIDLLEKLGLLRRTMVQKILRLAYGYNFKLFEFIALPVAENTFELGTHSYFISRKFAEQMLCFNRPVYLPADIAMMELAKTRKFNCYRLVRSLVAQSESPSSISNASINKLESRITEVSMEVSP